MSVQLSQVNGPDLIATDRPEVAGLTQPTWLGCTDQHADFTRIWPGPKVEIRMPLQLTRSSFRNIVLQSGLVTAERLDAVDLGSGSDTQTAEALSARLVEQGDVTSR